MSLPLPVVGAVQPVDGALVDRFGRRHTYLRVSVTDRCNYRCVYCMPKEGLDWLPRADLLSFEEIERIAAVFVRNGVTRIRLTGGEPTVRRGLPDLVKRLGALPGLTDLAMTTNGHAFAPMATRLADAGLRRINVSIDALDPSLFSELTRGGNVAKVLDAIAAARAAGIVPIKLNCVVLRGRNESEVASLVEAFAPHAADTVVRFIEYMPFDGNDARRHHVPVAEIRERLAQRFGLVPSDAPRHGGPAKLYTVPSTGQLVGFISPITEHFCEACNRLRLSADGHLRTCLSRDKMPSLREGLRAGWTDAELETALRGAVWNKVAGHEAHLVEGARAFEGVMTRVGG